jgi:5-methyltetrahydrofolate--homocysteine methyltransferase
MSDTPACSYLDAVRSRVVIFDGAAGTTFQRAELTADDYGGPDLEGCHELLNVTRPELVASLHDSFLSVGCDVVETNTFGAFGVPLGEYGVADRAFEVARAGAEIAVEVARSHATAEHPRWVAGSIGPGTKFPSLGQIRYRRLRDLYEIQASGLLAGGVDLFIIETQFDLLGLKAAVNGCRRAMVAAGRRIPVQAQVTIELTGRMLPGTEIGAAVAAIEPLGVDVMGVNCATGPSEMWEHVRYLSHVSRLPISVIPNAGLPSVVDGEMVYDLTAAELADHHRRFVSELGVSVIGGCCGTTPEHLAAVVETCRDLVPAPRDPAWEPGATSIYSFVPFHQDASFLIIGERTNANGSLAFRDAMLAEDVDACIKIGVEQVRESAHLVDLCVDYVGRDGTADMDNIARSFATQVAAPIVLDSTEPQVMEAGLEWIGGRAVLNSANLEDGDAEGSRADRVFKLAKEHGAAVICLLIDERGQARDVEWKMAIAHRLHELAVNRYGLAPSDLIFDALTFPLSTGDADLRRDGIATIEAIRRIKAELPGVATVLGVSNCSFGLRPAARHVLNSVFLHDAVEAGLDAAIIHAGKIVPLAKIDAEQRRVCSDLVWDRRGLEGGDGTDPDYDPLMRLLEVFAGVESVKKVIEDRTGWSIEKRLAQRIIDGDRDGLIDELDEAMTLMRPLDIINEVLLEGMRVVGERFGSGEMQLPFVLQSAETMKAAVRHLEPHLERNDQGGKGRVVLATVRGDVHDIGKNLVDIILSNNGYETFNLGIKVSITEMIDKALEVGADAIGMSGLLVKSTLIMRDNLEELARRGLDRIPVLLGGAALTRSYVERDLRERYPGRLFYGKDAFEGLRVLERLGDIKRSGHDDPDFGRIPEGRSRAGRRAASTEPVAVVRSPDVVADNPVFEPPFVGSRVVKGMSLDDIAAYLNETALFRNQWQYRPESGETDAEFKVRVRPELRARLAAAKADGLLVPQVVYGYFPANGDGNDLVIWNEERTEELTRFTFPRQREGAGLCIADFFRPPPEVDYAAFHIVTMGAHVSEVAADHFGADRYTDYLHTHGLGVEMAEALAEYWHHRIRTEWGFVDEDGPTLSGLFRQQYRGGRYSWGYPACPDLEDNARVADLLGAERIGVACSEATSWQYQPEQTTSAIICHHPQAKYFIAR